MSLKDRLFEPVNAAPLALLRVGFGAILFWEAFRYVNNGWVTAYYIEPTFFFKYPGFEWVPHPSPTVLWGIMAVWAIAAIAVMMGAFYRIAAPVLTVAVAWVFLLDSTHYLNHIYFVILLGFVLSVSPANAALSFDARRNPAIARTHVHAWSLWLVRFQIGIVYFFGGIAKLNADWMRGEPLHLWLSHLKQPFPFNQELWLAQSFSWTGVAFDLLIVPALLWSRTRWFAVAAALVFNLTNAYLWHIGIFPWLMLVATLVFFPPDSVWLTRVAGTDAPVPDTFPRPKHARLITIGLAVWVIFHLVLPLRHFVYPGPASWTEEGHRFAWRMKLRDKQTRAEFYLVLDDGKSFKVNALKHVGIRQHQQMVSKPEMVCQFTRQLAETYRPKYGNVEVYALVATSLNGREPQFLVDRRRNMANCVWPLFASADWIQPFQDTELGRLEDFVRDIDQD